MKTDIPMDDYIESVIARHLAYCRRNNWAGYEPYDALNSKCFEALPFLDLRIPRLILTQALKRSPVNIRRLLLIPHKQNPKALGIFLSALLKLPTPGSADVEGDIDLMIRRLIALRSQNSQFWCWGYCFPWQTRTVLVPAWTPNLVYTAIVAEALLDAYERKHQLDCLSMAVSAAEYILRELYWTDDDSSAGFSYPLPSVGDRNRVHNANFLGAALLCRVYRHTGDRRFLAPALKVAGYSAGKQEANGSWFYGEASTQRWIDNFHTAYNLCALREIDQCLNTEEFEPYIRRGFEFYVNHFLQRDGSVRYYHDRQYPVDSHSIAQTIITLLTLKDLDPRSVDSAHSVFHWAMRHMWDERGFFYFQIHRFWTNRISYMRWTQAWMLLSNIVLRSELPALRNVQVPLTA